MASALRDGHSGLLVAVWGRPERPGSWSSVEGAFTEGPDWGTEASLVPGLPEALTSLVGDPASLLLSLEVMDA